MNITTWFGFSSQYFVRDTCDNFDCLLSNKHNKKYIIRDVIWYVIGNVSVSPFIIESGVLELKRRIDLMNFICMTPMWPMLLNPYTSQPYVNTGNTSWSNNSNDKSADSASTVVSSAYS